MRTLIAISAFIDVVNKQLSKIARWLVLICCLISAGNAFSRYLINMSSNAWLEIGRAHV